MRSFHFVVSFLSLRSKKESIAPPMGGALIKLSDKVYNCSDLIRSPIEGWSHAQVVVYLNQAREVVDALPAVSEPLKERFYAIYNSLEK